MVENEKRYEKPSSSFHGWRSNTHAFTSMHQQNKIHLEASMSRFQIAVALLIFISFLASASGHGHHAGKKTGGNGNTNNDNGNVKISGNGSPSLGNTNTGGTNVGSGNTDNGDSSSGNMNNGVNSNRNDGCTNNSTGNNSNGSRNSSMNIGTRTTRKVAREFVNAHNAIRAMYKQKPICWDRKLAKVARRWAFERRNDCMLIHSHGPYGENLFWSLKPSWAPTDVVNMWADEYKFYDSLTNECINNAVCGHYTQIVWHNTERIGCGRIECSGKKGYLYVCSYDPPGNFYNEGPFGGLFEKSIVSSLHATPSSAPPPTTAAPSSVTNSIHLPFPFSGKHLLHKIFGGTT